LPVYYSVKIGTAKSGKGWELEMIHLKLYLENNHPEVQQFHISHGFNMLQVNRTWEFDKFKLRTGTGMVIAHPENIVRGMKLEGGGILNSGYSIAGPCVQVSAGKDIPLRGNLYISIEAKTLAAITKIRIYGGHALVSHAGLHALLGLGYRFNSPNRL